MSAITTHVLDTSRGRPAAGVPVTLDRRDGAGEPWRPVGDGQTDADGRLRTLLPAEFRLQPGEYRLTFDARTYFAAQAVRTFYPTIVIHFEVTEGETHYHVPILLAPFGYTTYRGS
jgi:5-hydroxyisourate hydrolase